MYFIRKDGQSFGPFTEDEIRELYQSGSIGSATETAWEGVDEWKPLNQWNFIKETPKKQESPAFNTSSSVTQPIYQSDTPEQFVQPFQFSPPLDSPLIGVILITILYGLSSLGCLCVAVFAFIMQHASRSVFTGPQSSGFALILQSLGIFIGIFTLAIAIFHAFIVYGLIKRRNWARITVIVLSSLGLLSQLRACLIINAQNAPFVIMTSLLMTALFIAIIIYMSRSTVQAHFS